jgi:hypothetical protein
MISDVPLRSRKTALPLSALLSSNTEFDKQRYAEIAVIAPPNAALFSLK